MVTPEQLLNILYVMIGWATITTIPLILARRDVKLGLKKWWYLKRSMQPIKLRYHGPDKNVIEHILATKGKGETVTIDDKKMFFLKTQDGSTFFLDEESIRRTDDGINEISYNYRSIMPLTPEETEEEAAEKRKKILDTIKANKKEEQEAKEGFQGVQMENLGQFTDPKRLNRLIEYVKLAAKTDALMKATDVEKYVKWTLYGTGAAVLGIFIVWYTLDNQIVPTLAQIMGAINNLGTSVLNV